MTKDHYAVLLAMQVRTSVLVLHSSAAAEPLQYWGTALLSSQPPRPGEQVERINHKFDLTNAQRGGTNEGWEKYRQMLLNSYPRRDAEANFNRAARQAYIGLAQLDTEVLVEERGAPATVDEGSTNVLQS